MHRPATSSILPRRAVSALRLLLGSLVLAGAASAADAKAAARSPNEPPFTVAKPALRPIDKPDAVVQMDGTGAGLDKLHAAFRAGGTVVIDSGGKPMTIVLDKELVMAQAAKPLVLDGLGLVTFDGQGKTRAIAKEWKTDLTVQRCRFVHCRADKLGGAIATINFDGALAVIDCQFEDCKTTSKGPDIGGGAIGVRGQRPMLISNCSFTDCAASNGGAINTIQCLVQLIDCSFERCEAFGIGGGADQGPTGQGGIGGAVYCDSVSFTSPDWEYFVAGCLFTGNHAGDHAGAMFAYTDPSKLAGTIFWNDHFEANSVGPAGAKVRHAGAIYTQDSRHLWVGGCSFWDNACPGVGGAIFTAGNVQQTFINCEFHGNKPEFSGKGDNLVFTRSDIPPCVAALGNRMPGPVLKKLAKKVEKLEKAEKPASAPGGPAGPVAERAKPQPDAIAAYTKRLQDSARDAAATGRGPIFELSTLKSKVTVEQADAGGLTVRMGESVLTVTWASLDDGDRAELATALTRSDAPADHALAAFWLRVAGRDADAAAQTGKAGDEAGSIEAAFAAK